MMSQDPTAGPRPRRGRWTRSLVVQVVLILLIPVILSAVLGWFDLNPVEAEKFSTVGSEAHNLLNGFPDGRLVVEVDYQSSAGPPPASALATLGARINQTCTKSSVGLQEYSFASIQTSFSESDLLSLETSVRHTWPTPGTMALDYLYLNGGFADNSAVLGLAYLGSSIAIFEGTIVASAPAGGSAAVTTTVMVHEFGHELGLVGILGSAPNEDPNHPFHSGDSNDVMYWAVDTTALPFGLGGASPPTQFDSADLSDLSTAKATPILNEIFPWVVLAASIVAALAVAVHGLRAGRRA